MASKGEALLRKRKEAKQKKLVIMLVPVLLILMVVMVPRTLKQLNPKPPATPAPAATAATATTATTGEAAPPPPAVLTDSDVRPEADDGQLVSFDRFVGRDPFRQLVSATEDANGANGSDAGTEPGTAATVPTAPPAATPPASDTGGGDTATPKPAASANLIVNGVSEAVEKSKTFPASNPVFTLVEVTAKGVEIGLVGGVYSTGAGTVTVAVGETLTLVAQPDGTRYEIKLVSVTA